MSMNNEIKTSTVFEDEIELSLLAEIDILNKENQELRDRIELLENMIMYGERRYFA